LAGFLDLSSNTLQVERQARIEDVFLRGEAVHVEEARIGCREALHDLLKPLSPQFIARFKCCEGGRVLQERLIEVFIKTGRKLIGNILLAEWTYPFAALQVRNTLLDPIAVAELLNNGGNIDIRFSENAA
jgi:hypothetical protein